MSASRPVLITMGDPAGIGPEIIAKAFAARDRRYGKVASNEYEASNA